jgi:rubrerythrin
MSATMAIQPAKVVVADGRRWWSCPNCNRRLAEIVGDRAVVEIGERRYTMAVRAEPDQTCPRCGTVSVLEVA